jgi:hypothetical protein
LADRLSANEAATSVALATWQSSRQSFAPHPSEQLRRRSASRLILEIDIGELLPAVVAHDKGGTNVLDSPRRREAASSHLRIRSKAVGPLANRRLCLVPTRAAATPRRSGNGWVSDQHRGETAKVRLRTSIRSRWRLSHLFSRVSRGFDRWAGSGGRGRYCFFLAAADGVVAAADGVVAAPDGVSWGSAHGSGLFFFGFGSLSIVDW